MSYIICHCYWLKILNTTYLHILSCYNVSAEKTKSIKANLSFFVYRCNTHSNFLQNTTPPPISNRKFVDFLPAYCYLPQTNKQSLLVSTILRTCLINLFFSFFHLLHRCPVCLFNLHIIIAAFFGFASNYKTPLLQANNQLVAGVYV